MGYYNQLEELKGMEVKRLVIHPENNLYHFIFETLKLNSGDVFGIDYLRSEGNYKTYNISIIDSNTEMEIESYFVICKHDEGTGKQYIETVQSNI